MDQVLGILIPSELAVMMPYVLTILVLTLSLSKGMAPRSQKRLNGRVKIYPSEYRRKKEKMKNQSAVRSVSFRLVLAACTPQNQNPASRWLDEPLRRHVTPSNINDLAFSQVFQTP